MKNVKILAFVMALIVVLTMSFGVYAKGGEVINVNVKTDKNDYMQGDDVVVTLDVSANYNALNMRWLLLYSSDIFELGDNNGDFAVCKSFEDFGGTTMSNMTGENVPYPSGYSSADYSAVVVQWTGGGQNIATFNSATSVDFVTFNLKVKSDAESGSEGKIFIPENWGMFYNLAIEDVTDATTYYRANDLVYNFTSADVTVDASSTAELLPVDGSSTVIDKENGIIYGFNDGLYFIDQVADYVYATGDGEVNFVETEAGTGTGSEIQLVKNGEVLESYTVIYFGDISGDCVIDETDFILLDSYINFISEIEYGSPYYLAADLSGDDVVDETDLVMLDNIINFIGELDQSTREIIPY